MSIATDLMGLSMPAPPAAYLGSLFNNISVLVTTFGATGDGVTDDTAAVRAALAFAYNNGIGKITFPSGTYLVSSVSGAGALTCSAPIILEGEGPGSVLKLKTGSTGFLVHAYNATPFTGLILSNLTIDGNNVSTAQLDAGLVQIQNVAWFLCHRLWVKNGTRASGASGINGISVSDSGSNVTSGIIYDCLIEDCSKGLINWTSGAKNGLILGNICTSGSGNGLTPGIQINGGFNGKVIGNFIYENQGSGILVATDGSGNAPRDALIAFNHIYDNGQGTTEGAGIKITRTGGTAGGKFIVAHNHIVGNGVGLNASAIQLANDREIIINGNFISDHKLAAIAIGGSTSTWDDALITDNVFKNNNLSNNSGVGIIFLQGTLDKIVIKNNRFVDTQGTSTMWFPFFASTGTFSNFHIEDNDFNGMLNRQGMGFNSAGVFSNSRLSFRYGYSSSDATVIPLLTVPMRDNSAMKALIEAIGTKSDGSNRAFYNYSDLWYRNGGAPTQQGVITNAEVESDATWIGPSFTASSNNLLANLAGKAATAIDWRVLAEVDIG